MRRLRSLTARQRTLLGTLVTALCVALVVVWCSTLSVCDPNVNESGLTWTSSEDGSDADRVTQEVNNLMETLQDPADNDLGNVTSKLANDQRLAIDLVASHGIDVPALCAHLFSGATYTLGSVSVEGESATVELDLTHKPFGRLANDTNRDFSSLMDSAEGTSLLSQGIDALLERYEGLYLDRLDASNDAVTDSFTVSLAKTNGSWSIDSTSIRSMAATLVEGVELPVDL